MMGDDIKISVGLPGDNLYVSGSEEATRVLQNALYELEAFRRDRTTDLQFLRDRIDDLEQRIIDRKNWLRDGACRIETEEEREAVAEEMAQRLVDVVYAKGRALARNWVDIHGAQAIRGDQPIDLSFPLEMVGLDVIQILERVRRTKAKHDAEGDA